MVFYEPIPGDYRVWVSEPFVGVFEFVVDEYEDDSWQPHRKMTELELLEFLRDCTQVHSSNVYDYWRRKP